MKQLFIILILYSQGSRWRSLRSASNPIVARPQTIQFYLPNHNEVADEFIKLIYQKVNSASKSAQFDQFEENLRLLTLECIISCFNDLI